MAKSSLISVSYYTAYIRLYSKWIATIFLALSVCFFGYYFFARTMAVENAQAWLLQDIERENSILFKHIQEHLNYTQKSLTRPIIAQAVKTLVSGNVTQAQRVAVNKELTQFFDEYADERNYKNTLLLDVNGKVLFSDFAPEYVDKVVTQEGMISDSPLGRSFNRAIMSLTPDIAWFTYDPVLNRPAFFVSVPIVYEKKLIGVIAQEIKSEQIYAIVEHYVGLGTGGDLVFGLPERDGILFISASRLQGTTPFKHFVFYNRLGASLENNGLARAAFGKKGTDNEKNEQNQEYITGWSYVPYAEWSAAGLINISEITKKLWLPRYSAWLFLYVAFLFFLITYAVMLSQKIKECLRSKRCVSWILCVLCGLVVLIIGLKLFSLIRDVRNGVYETKKNMQRIVNGGAHQLDKITQQLESVGFSVANALYTNAIPKKDLIEYLKKIVDGNDDVFGLTVAYEPYMYDKNTRLYAPFVRQKKKDIELFFYEQIFDYSKERAVTIGPVVWPWYSEGIKHPVIWFDPFYDKDIDAIVTSYSVPFYSADDVQRVKPAGVVNVMVKCNKLIDAARRMDFGSLGYASIIAKPAGRFIYHPQWRYVQSQFTIFDVAEEQGNTDLFAIGKSLLAGGKGFYSFKNAYTSEHMMVFAQPLPRLGWIINGVVSRESGALSNREVRHYSLQLLLLIILLICFVFLLIGKNHWLTLRTFAALMTVLLVVTLSATLFIIRMTPTYDQHEGVTIGDQSRLNQYIYEEEAYARKIHEPVTVKVPTGIQINHISFPASTIMEVSGYLWQRYSNDIKFPKEIDFESVNLGQFKKLYEVKKENETVIGWEFLVRLDQQFNYQQYPFDSITLNIIFEYPILDKPVLLIPTLMDYRSINPSSLPGFDPNFSLSGFNMDASLFAFEQYENEVSLGISVYKNLPTYTALTFKALMKRSLLYDFIVFFLPILIIFFLLYAVFILQEKEKLQLFTLSIYTGLIFAVTLMHRALRERLFTSDIVYIEYLFFMLYIAFLLLALYVLLRFFHSKAIAVVEKIFAIYKIFFWPIQLLVLLGITFMVFY